MMMNQTTRLINPDQGQREKTVVWVARLAHVGNLRNVVYSQDFTIDLK